MFIYKTILVQALRRAHPRDLVAAYPGRSGRPGRRQGRHRCPSSSATSSATSSEQQCHQQCHQQRAASSPAPISSRKLDQARNYFDQKKMVLAYLNLCWT